jgi:HEAT repeat protein
MKLDSRLPNQLFRRPTSDATTRGLLQDAIATFPANRASAVGKVQRLRSRDPLGILLAAVQLLEAADENSQNLEHAVGLLGSGSLLAELFMNPQVWSLEAAVALAKKLQAVEPRLDLRLVRQVLGKVGSVDSIAKDDALRLLGLIDAISDCSVLASYLIQFQRHPNDRVRSKAALMLGRSNSNPGRVESLLASDDDRIRANAVESLWGQSSKPARQLFLSAARDSSGRVVANALLGLFRAGDKNALARLGQLANASDPMMRCSGAWAMGETGDQRFVEVLQVLVQDPSAAVRENAEESRQKLAAQVTVTPSGSSSDAKADPSPADSTVITGAELRPEGELKNGQAKSAEPAVGEPENEPPENTRPGTGWMTGQRATE